MVMRVDKPPFPFPVPQLKDTMVHSGPLFAFPLPEEPSRSARTFETRARTMGAVVRAIFRAASIPVSTEHLAAVRWFLLGTFAGLVFACSLVLAIRGQEGAAPKRAATTAATTGARSMILLRPAIALDRAPAGAVAKASAPAPATGAKRVAKARATNILAAALSP